MKINEEEVSDVYVLEKILHSPNSKFYYKVVATEEAKAHGIITSPWRKDEKKEGANRRTSFAGKIIF